MADDHLPTSPAPDAAPAPHPDAAPRNEHVPAPAAKAGFWRSLWGGSPAPAPVAPPGAHPDSTREIIETIVFVVVLVLMLKSFAAEAFVIPTGSMAETLWGYQKVVTCPECGHQFPVNCSTQVEEHSGPVTGCECPNCQLNISLVQGRFPGEEKD